MTKEEEYAMQNLSRLAPNCMRSKIVLKTLSKLADKGWIDFDPMAGEAAITEEGRKELDA